MSNDFKAITTFYFITLVYHVPKISGSTSLFRKQQIYAVMISVVVGFYDGFIGLAQGALVVAFIALMVLIFARFRKC
jgi:uncharacterized membrane protein YfcA